MDKMNISLNVTCEEMNKTIGYIEKAVVISLVDMVLIPK